MSYAYVMSSCTAGHTLKIPVACVCACVCVCGGVQCSQDEVQDTYLGIHIIICYLLLFLYHFH